MALSGTSADLVASLPKTVEGALAWVRRPPPPMELDLVVMALALGDRFGVLERAIETGLLDAQYDISPTTLMHIAVSSAGGLRLLRCLRRHGVPATITDGACPGCLSFVIVLPHKKNVLVLTNPSVPSIQRWGGIRCITP